MAESAKPSDAAVAPGTTPVAPRGSAAPVAADPALAPIVLTLVVPCPPERAFDYFTRDIARWWPLDDYSCGQHDAAKVEIEPRVGGRLFETTRDGATHPWGIVRDWQPGRHVRFSWHPGVDPARAQWVEVTFAAHPSGTLVTLTHGGWEAVGERAGAMRGNYAGGWQTVFGQRFAGYCAAAADPERAR